jgi:CHAT domain-containing protein
MSKKFLSAIFSCLMLPGIVIAHDQAKQAGGSCGTIIDAADKSRASERAEDQTKALSLYQAAVDCLGPAPTQLRAETLMKFSRFRLSLEQYSPAVDNLRDALTTLQQLADQNLAVQTDEAKVNGNLGYALKMLAQLDQALPYFDEARKDFEKLGDLHFTAYSYEQLGLVHFLQSDYKDSQESYEQAFKILDRLVDNKDNRQQKAALLDMQGRISAQLNQFGDAEGNYQKALKLARETDYRKFIVLTLNDMGALRLKQNRPLAAEHAEYYHRLALSELQKYRIADTSLAETQALLADALTAQGRYDLALQNYHQALERQEKARDVIGQAQTHLGLGMLESTTRNWSEAKSSFLRAAELYGGAHSPVGESTARFRNAVAFATQGNDTAAKLEIQGAIALAEKVRRFVPGSDLKASYFITVEQMYRFAINLLLNVQGTAPEADRLEAFALFQRAQYRTLLDSLGAKLHASLLGEASLKQTEDEAINRDPRLGLFSNVVSAEDIRQRVLDQDSALIQFYLAEPSSYAWVITQSGTDLVKLPSRRILEPDVRRVLQFGLAAQWTGAQQLALNRLRRDLAPVLQAAQKKRWVVVPDGALHFFPFTLLTSLQGQDDAPEEFVKIPCASAIDIVRRTVHTTRPAYALAVFADPVFDDLDSRVAAHRLQANGRSLSTARRSVHLQGASLPRLRYTLKEAHALYQLFPADQSRAFLQFAATREAAAGNALENFRIIHLATHSLPDERHPELSKIVFSQVTEYGDPRPGELFARDIYQMKLASDLVVLSSCQGAIGKQQPGEGPMSLARALLFAGSKAVVASLWEVNDEATAELMQQFYRRMVQDKLLPSTALALAQSEFRHHPEKRFRNPYYWAGFELYGEWMK